MEKIFLDSHPKTRKARRKKFLDRHSRHTIAVFWTYDDILLRHFYDLSKSGDYRTLVKSGDATDAECAEAWDKIVQKNNYHSGSNQYNNYLNLIKQYNLAIKELIAVESTIECLWFVVDEEQIKFLKSKGYKIDTSGYLAYATSLTVAAHESGKIRTKIKIRYNQINTFNQRAIESRGQEEITLDEMLTALSMEVGFQLPDSITLAQYNAYAKRIKKRSEALERSHKKQNART